MNNITSITILYTPIYFLSFTIYYSYFLHFYAYFNCLSVYAYPYPYPYSCFYYCFYAPGVALNAYFFTFLGLFNDTKYFLNSSYCFLNCKADSSVVLLYMVPFTITFFKKCIYIFVSILHFSSSDVHTVR